MALSEQIEEARRAADSWQGMYRVAAARADEAQRERDELRTQRDEWKRIAHVESQGNHCAWQHKTEQAQALLRRICDAQLAGDRDGLAAAVRDALELLREVR